MMLRITVMVLSILMLLSCFASCAQGNGDKTTDSGKKDESAATAKLDSEYLVVRANSADELTIQAAMLLRELINEKASLSVSLKTDFLKKDEKAPEKEIILGTTNRETKFDRNTLDKDQYYVGLEGSKVIIDAYDSLTLYFAVSNIVDKWLELGEGEFTLDKNVVSSLGSNIDVDSRKLKIMSQNMRYADDGNGNDIKDRAPRFKQLVEMYQPDIIGTQETTVKWNNYFRQYYKDVYGMVGCSREGKNATTGEWGTILYRLDRFELLAVLEGFTFDLAHSLGNSDLFQP